MGAASDTLAAWLDAWNARDANAQSHVRSHSRESVRNFLDEPGFIGIVTGFQAGRGYTVTVWEDEAARLVNAFPSSFVMLR